MPYLMLLLENAICIYVFGRDERLQIPKRQTRFNVRLVYVLSYLNATFGACGLDALDQSSRTTARFMKPRLSFMRASEVLIYDTSIDSMEEFVAHLFGIEAREKSLEF
ncbi:hypothetical protein TNCT_231001 [Trichonephila clavata]|uniref:Uncharacterized protein n=1 Tax=Trichonephila clavata TaxID=2740835 RepID=A0A8X6LVI7_TRICU|nr:hypothetical protein TNCT_231001 [Trichonephila clavata]